jgi:hypothetical protein
LKYTICVFLRSPTPENSELGAWLPVSSPDIGEYAHIKCNGLKMEDRLLKERAEFWTTLLHRDRLAAFKDEL